MRSTSPLPDGAHPSPLPAGAADGRSSDQETYDALVDVVRLAARAVTGCDAAGISLVGPAGFDTVAATDHTVREVDSAQYRRDDGPCLHAIRVGTLVRVDDFVTEPRWPSVANEAVAAGVRSSLSLPLTADGLTLGGLNMYGLVPGAFGAEAVTTAEVLARHAALALGYLRRYHDERTARARERQLADSLQRALLPTVSSLPGVEVAARYLSASAGGSVGGDWYDVFALPDGAVGVAVGDVMGHDVVAAAAMGQLRSVLRSYAYEGISPALVLDRMDRLIQGFGMAQLATAVYGRLILDNAGAMLLFANAGHLPPLLRHPDGAVERLERARSALIGAPLVEPVPRPETAVALGRGATLVLYTDGLVEDRRRPLDAGLDRLSAAVGAHPAGAPLDELCDAVITALDADRSDDDVALLALRVE
jgi:serine phosphatase RsbU (regulator of sigma subunit)